MATTKPYVRIQSAKTINVTIGLQCQDVTNADAHIPDRLKVNPLWPKASVLITSGVGIYPSEIVEWPTVKALITDNILTIGEYLDEPIANDMATVKQSIIATTEEINTARKTKRAQSLADIAE